MKLRNQGSGRLVPSGPSGTVQAGSAARFEMATIAKEYQTALKASLTGWDKWVLDRRSGRASREAIMDTRDLVLSAWKDVTEHQVVLAVGRAKAEELFRSEAVHREINAAIYEVTEDMVDWLYESRQRRSLNAARNMSSLEREYTSAFERGELDQDRYEKLMAGTRRDFDDRMAHSQSLTDRFIDDMMHKVQAILHRIEEDRSW